MSTARRLAANGEGELPIGVPARNHGAVVAIDPHQTAAAAVIMGMHTPTKTASDPSDLELRQADVEATGDGNGCYRPGDNGGSKQKRGDHERELVPPEPRVALVTGEMLGPDDQASNSDSGRHCD